MSRKAAYQESLKQDILRQTLAIAGEEGWPNVSTRKIADRLQTSTTAIYHYFGGKEAILIELQRDGFRRLHDVQAAALAIHPDDPEQQLVDVSLAVLQFAYEYPELYAVMFSLDGVSCHSNDAVEEMAATGDMLKAILAKLTKQDVHSVLAHWGATIQGFVAMARNESSPGADERFKQYVTESMQRFVKGL
ncbi:TetR/AcrR family transcriptional regulator [Spirosoma soli]|uniref:TetR/AcrR family transcriptional regulator n=1 Tax=Spirosoma soli TaxID=1770529 RepID=A0ABW5LZ49_9BACT